MLETGQKAHFEKLKLNWNSPTDWIVLDDGEVHSILDDETETEQETVALSEGAKPYAEEQSIASEERLRMKLPEESPMMTRSKLQEKEGKSRKHYCEPGSDDLSLFEEQLSLHEPLPKDYAGGEEVEKDGNYPDVKPPRRAVELCRWRNPN